ncbi:Zinc finger, CCHC-type [Corchorus capsularis]|uniref:Zinc finger, CCHC-type n=1 Tax=Corchorus capsularis TaxID=210143 RepID=A0A1R3G5C4_COCAP|nr:Zinc finger, CCHC-type [Corchorus capsularis]
MALIRKDPGLSMFRHIETVFQMGEEHILEGDPKWHLIVSLPDDWDTFKMGLFEKAITHSFLAVAVDIFVEDKRRRNISPTRGNIMEDPEVQRVIRFRSIRIPRRILTRMTIPRRILTRTRIPEDDFDPDEDPEEEFEVSASDIVPPQPPLPDHQPSQPPVSPRPLIFGGGPRIRQAARKSTARIFVMAELEQGSTAQHKRDQEAFQTWKRKNSIARITLLSCMTDELICEFEEYATAQGMWNALKEKFGNVSDTKLKQLVIKFDNYKKHPENNMGLHLQEMGWEYMNAMFIHNASIKTFADVQRHLELEEERLMAMSNHPEVNMAQSSKRGVSSHKRKKGGKNVKQDDNAEPHAKKAKINKRKRGRRAGKNRDKSKVTCYNCGKLGHFAL